MDVKKSGLFERSEFPDFRQLSAAAAFFPVEKKLEPVRLEHLNKMIF